LGLFYCLKNEVEAIIAKRLKKNFIGKKVQFACIYRCINKNMKDLLFIVLIPILVSSCDTQCYTCTREVARTADAPFPGYPVTAVTKFDATKEEAEAFNNLLIIEKDTVNGVVLTTNIKTVCGR